MVVLGFSVFFSFVQGFLVVFAPNLGVGFDFGFYKSGGWDSGDG